MSKRDNIVELNDFLAKIKTFKDAIEQFKQAQLKRTQEKEETLRALREQKHYKKR